MIALYKPYMPDGITEELNALLYSGRLTYGKYGMEFELALAEFLECANVITVNSFGTAMALVMLNLGIEPGDEIIASPMGCLRTTQPLACANAKVVWADIDPKTGTLSPESVRDKITDKTKLIVHTQHLGYPGYIDEINQLGKENSITVLNDCLDGIGAYYRGKHIETTSDVSVISFDAVRLPNCIEGAALVIKCDKLLAKMKMSRDLGVDRANYRDGDGEIRADWDIADKGMAATLNEVNSFIGLQQMKELGALLTQRRRNAENWIAKIASDYPDCKILPGAPDGSPNYWVFGILTDKKDQMFKRFRSEGFCASGVHCNNNRYSVFGKYEPLPGVEEFYQRFLALPCGWWMGEENE